ncbi:hypothetical protein [Pseudooceanicola nanhaiensis]|uniref:hypothetical protein n=1 Tax=Pseudooceanicola nanhaiensis TaxID=375761 RepID=UPI0035199DDD
MFEYLAAIPAAHLRKIIPNGWEEALAAAWKHEPKPSLDDQGKPKPGNQVYIARGKAVRAAILSAAQEFMTVAEIAAAIGEKPDTARNHIHTLRKQGRMRFMDCGAVTLWIATVPE